MPTTGAVAVAGGANARLRRTERELGTLIPAHGHSDRPLRSAGRLRQVAAAAGSIVADAIQRSNWAPVLSRTYSCWADAVWPCRPPLYDHQLIRMSDRLILSLVLPLV